MINRLFFVFLFALVTLTLLELNTTAPVASKLTSLQDIVRRRAHVRGMLLWVDGFAPTYPGHVARPSTNRHVFRVPLVRIVSVLAPHHERKSAKLT